MWRLSETGGRAAFHLLEREKVGSEGTYDGRAALKSVRVYPQLGGRELGSPWTCMVTCPPSVCQPPCGGKDRLLQKNASM